MISTSFLFWVKALFRKGVREDIFTFTVPSGRHDRREDFDFIVRVYADII